MGWVSRTITYKHFSGSCAISPDGSTIAYGYSGGQSTDGVQVIKNYGTPFETSLFISVPSYNGEPPYYGYGISLDKNGTYIAATGVAGSFFSGKGSSGTGHLYNLLPSPNLKSTGNSIVTDSNIFSPFFIGNGSLLQDLSAAAISGTVASAQIVTQAEQPAITSLGTLSGLTVAGQVAGTQFIGDGSALSGIQSANISQPFSNLEVSNALTTTNVFAATTVLTGTTGQTSLLVTGNIYASDALTTKNVFAATTVITGTTGRTSLLVTGNIYASNAVQTTNLYASRANVATLNVTSTFEGPLITVNSTTTIAGLGASAAGVNSSAFGIGASTSAIGATATGNTARALGQSSSAFGDQALAGVLYSTAVGYLSSARAQRSTAIGSSASAAVAADDSTAIGSGASAGFTNSTAIGAGAVAGGSNVVVFPNSANIGIGTGLPGARLHVVGNIFASNSLSTTNVVASSTLRVGPGTIGSNIALFSNVAGGQNVVVINSNAWVGIGTTNPTSSLQVNGNALFSTDTFAVPFATVGTLGVLSGVTIGPSSTVLGSNLMVISNASGGSNVTIFTGNALSIGTLAPLATFHVVGSMGSNIAVFSNGYSSSNGIFVIDQYSNVGIGRVPGPGYQLDVSSDLVRKATSASWFGGSDIRVKTDIQLADTSICYNNIKSLKLKYFKWNFPDGTPVIDRHMLGYIAQEVREYFPNSVVEGESYGIPDFLSLDTDQIIKSMYGALQKTMADKEILEEKLEMAQNDIDLLETRLSDLEAIVRTLLPQKETTQTGPRSAALMGMT